MYLLFPGLTFYAMAIAIAAGGYARDNGLIWLGLGMTYVASAILVVAIYIIRSESKSPPKSPK